MVITTAVAIDTTTRITTATTVITTVTTTMVQRFFEFVHDSTIVQCGFAFDRREGRY